MQAARRIVASAEWRSIRASAGIWRRVARGEKTHRYRRGMPPWGQRASVECRVASAEWLGIACTSLYPVITRPSALVTRHSLILHCRNDDGVRFATMQREVHRRGRGATIGDFLLAAALVDLARVELRVRHRIESARTTSGRYVGADDLELDIVEPRLARAAEHEAIGEADGVARNVENDLLTRPIGGEHERAILHEVRRLHGALTVDAHEEDGCAFIDSDCLEEAGEAHTLASIGIGAHALREHRRSAWRSDIRLDAGAGVALPAVTARDVGAHRVFAGAIGDRLPAGGNLRVRGEGREHEAGARERETSNREHT